MSGPDRIAALAEDLRTVVGRLKRRLREQGNVGDLTPSQVSAVLQLEALGSATVSALARAEGMRAQSMSTLLAPLLAAGLVSSAPDSDDRRQVLLSLSDDCRRTLLSGRAARQDWLARTLADRLSGDELDLLADALPLLRRLLEGNR